jgi:cyclophilin family peptidyl-prolyl cis-trans isomerase
MRSTRRQSAARRGLLGLRLLAAVCMACGPESGGGAGGQPGASQAGSAPAATPQAAPPGAALPPSGGPRDVASIRVRDFGEIRIELLPELAPKTVENFVKLAESGFYDGTTFHRVIPGFAIQGGDPNTRNRDPRDDGRGGPGYGIPDEFGPVPQVRGLVSMANMSRPETGGSQFYILVGDAPPLTGKYAAFGRVVAGMEVADRIALVERDPYGRFGPPDRPRSDVVMESVRIERAAPPAVAERGAPATRAAGGEETASRP